MQEVVPLDVIHKRRRARLRALARAAQPTRIEFACAILSALALTLAFPDFNLWPLAWVGLVPLFVVIARRPRAPQSFVLGWTTGSLFFYASCWWLTYSMIHYGHIPAPLAFLLLVPPALLVGLFPALAALVLARLCARWGARALFLAAPVWVACEWARLGVTGQLWNAIGYSQAYRPALIQSARWGGVYAVGCLIVLTNGALAFALLRRTTRATIYALAICVLVALSVALPVIADGRQARAVLTPAAVIIAVQPDVPITFERTPEETNALIARHLSLSAAALRAWDKQEALADANDRPNQNAQTQRAQIQPAQTGSTSLPRVVIWPESPMNFTYTDDAEFRELVGGFARAQQTTVLFNSQEPAPLNGAYNSAVMVDAEGRLVAQYDKIRLLPFGEYVPLPRWFPGAWLLSGLVGDFTPGTKYPLMPIGAARGGVFICFESAFPEIARTFARAGADVLINISNDGYLGRTPVLRQHLANAVFRAVENERPVVRVTNTGISALITARGAVLDATDSFTPATRTWLVTRAVDGQTFYTRHGDLFVMLCAVASVLALALTVNPVSKFLLRRRALEQ